MATFPNLFQCKNPWTFRKGWLQNGGETLSASSEPVVEVRELTREEIKEQEIKERKELASEISNQFLKPQEDGTFKIDFGVGDPNKNQTEAKGFQNANRLDMMLPNDVTKVSLKSLYYGKTVELTKADNGRFYEPGKAPPADKHFYVFQNDEVTVLDRNTEITVQVPAPTAAEATLTTPTNTPTEAPTALSPNQTRINDGLEVKYGEAIQFPPEFRGKTGSQIESMLATSDFGVQAKRALDTLNKMQGERASTIGLLEDMRTHNMFSKNRLGYEEIAQHIFDTSIVDLQMEYGNITEKKQEEPLTPVEANRLAQLELFFLTIMDLKYAIESLKNRASESQETRVENLTEEEKMLNLVFDKNDNGPVIKPSLRDWFHGQRRHTLSIDYTKGQEKLENAIDSYTDNYSEAAAWNKIRVECSDAAGNLDPEKLRIELNRLLALGKVQAKLMDHPRKNEQVLPISVDQLHDPDTLANKKEFIQLGFSKDLRDKAKAQEEALDGGRNIDSLSPEVNKAIQQETALYLGAMIKDGDLNTLGAAISKNIGTTENGKPIFLYLGGTGNVMTRQVTIGLGASAEVLRTEDIRISIAGGLNFSAAGLGVGIAPPIEVPLGEKNIWSIQFTPSLGVNGLGVALGAALGVRRDLQGVYEQKVEKEKDAFLAENPEFNTPEFQADLQAIAEAKGLDAMDTLQFTSVGIGVTFIPPELFIPYPYVTVAIKGKTYRVFEDPSKYSSDEKIQAAISASQKETAGGNSITVYESGPLLTDENGEFKVGQANIDRDPNADAAKRIEEINTLLKDKNMSLVLEDDKRVSLNVGNRRGNLKVYADPAGTVEIYPENGKIYLNWDATESLSVERVDEWSSRMKENAYQNTLIYIGNKGMDTSSVTTNSDSHIQMGGLLSELTEMKDKEGIASLNTVAANATELGSQYKTFIPKDWAERQTLVNSIKDKVMSNDTLTLSEDQKTRITQAVNTLMSKDSTRQEYKRLSTEGNRSDLIAMLNKYNEENPWDDFDIKVNNEVELNAFLQAIMEASLLDLDTSDADRVKRSLDWNRSKMAAELVKLGLEANAAQSISNDFINNFNLAEASRTAIPEYSQVVIAVGTEGFEGTRTSSWRAGGELLGGIDVMTDPRFNTMRESLPDNALTSSIGLQLLPAADLMFTTAELKELEAMVGTDNPNKESPAYKKFAEIVNTLYKNQTWTSPEGNVTITPDIFWKVGLYGKCLNYCEVYNTKLKVDVKGPEFETRSAQTLNYIESHPQVNFIGVGGAVAVAPGGGEKQEEGGAAQGGEEDELPQADPDSPMEHSDSDDLGGPATE